MCVTLRRALQRALVALGQRVHVSYTSRQINSLQAGHVFLISSCLAVCLSSWLCAFLFTVAKHVLWWMNFLQWQGWYRCTKSQAWGTLSSLSEDRAHLCMSLHILYPQVHLCRHQIPIYTIPDMYIHRHKCAHNILSRMAILTGSGPPSSALLAGST